MALFEFHIHNHVDLDKVLKELKRITLKLNTMAATIEQFEAALQRIDTATTGIAEQIRDLQDQITDAGLSAEQETNVLGRLDTIASSLENMGKDVNNPTPEETAPGETAA